MNLFSRALGSAVGVAVLATLANAAARSTVLSGHRDLVFVASTAAFRGVVVAALLMIVMVIFMPSDAARSAQARPEHLN
jgi:hypothetical protein